MKKIGAYEVKAKLSEILEKVAMGEFFTITRRGEPIAVLSPAKREVERERSEAIQDLKNFRKGRRLGSALKIRDLIESGRS